MVNARAVGRIGILAAGLGIGAAMASTPGTASADSSTDPFSWIAGSDPGGLAAASTPLDFQISIDGTDLLPTADNLATATSDMGDIAIAIGDGARAEATDGFLNLAMADGANSAAHATVGNFLAAFANGAGSNADASEGDVDIATAFGDNTTAGADLGNLNTASIFDPAGGGFAGAGEGNSDLTFVLGDSTASAGGFDVGTNVLGNNDIATIFGNGDVAESGANPVTPGDFDLGAIFGNDLGTADATGANFLVDILPAIAGLDSALSNFLADIGSLF